MRLYAVACLSVLVCKQVTILSILTNNCYEIVLLLPTPVLQKYLIMLRLMKADKRKFTILDNISGIIPPGTWLSEVLC